MTSTRLILARIWYLLVGGIATLIGAGSLLGPILGGCRVVFSQADVHGPGSCVQYLDPLFLAQTLVIGALSLVAGAFVLSRNPVARVLVLPGIVAGALAGFAPAGVLVWAIDYYRYAPSPLEIGVGLLPAAVAIAGAVALSRAWWSAGRAPRMEGSAV
jgi:hypothetical protein